MKIEDLGEATEVVVSFDGRHVGVLDDGVLRLVREDGRPCRRTFRGPEIVRYSIVGAAGDVVVGVAVDGRVWKANEGVMRPISAPDPALYLGSFAMMPQSDLFAAVGTYGSVRIFDVASGGALLERNMSHLGIVVGAAALEGGFVTFHKKRVDQRGAGPMCQALLWRSMGGDWKEVELWSTQGDVQRVATGFESETVACVVSVPGADEIWCLTPRTVDASCLRIGLHDFDVLGLGFLGRRCLVISCETGFIGMNTDGEELFRSDMGCGGIVQSSTDGLIWGFTYIPRGGREPRAMLIDERLG